MASLLEQAPRSGFRDHHVVSQDGRVTRAKGCGEEKRALKRSGTGVKIHPGEAAKWGCWEAAASRLCPWDRDIRQL